MTKPRGFQLTRVNVEAEVLAEATELRHAGGFVPGGLLRCKERFGYGRVAAACAALEERGTITRGPDGYHASKEHAHV